MPGTSNDTANFREQCLLLRQGGTWKEANGDSLPLAVANMYNCKYVQVQIFSSNTENSIYDIKLNLSTEGTTDNTINLEYTSLLERDYYYAT